MNFSRSTVAVRFAAVLALGMAAAPAFAIPIYDTNGFTSTTRFVPNTSLEGSDLATGGPWVITNTTNPAQANVRPTVGVGGGQGIEVITAGNKDNTQWFVSKPVVPVTPLNVVTVDWSMNYVKTTVPNLDFGPFFGVEIFDASMPGLPKQVGSFGVDSTTGDLLVAIDQGSGPEFAPLLTPTTLAAGSYNNFQIAVDYVAKTYAIKLNGTTLETNPFLNATATAFTDAPISTRFLSFNGDQPLNAGTAYFDNYVINVVPEPTMIAGVAMFALGMVRRRR